MFCTFVLLRTIGRSRTRVVIIYLQVIKYLPFSSFNSLEKVPLPLFEFLAHGVYLVPPLAFPTKLRHCGTFKVFAPYLSRRRCFPCRQLSFDRAALGLLFHQARTLQASQLVRAWTFLYRSIKTAAIT